MKRPVFSFLATIAVATSAAGEPPRLDVNGDPLPAGAVARLGSTRWRNIGPFRYSPDGKAIVHLAPDGSVVWLDADTGREVRRVRGAEPIQSFEFCMDGKALIVGDRAPLSVYAPLPRSDPELGLRLLDLGTGEFSAQFRTRGGLLAAGGKFAVIQGGANRFIESPFLMVVDAKRQLEIWRTSDKLDTYYAAHISPDGKLTAVLGQKTAQVCIWDTTTNKLLEMHGLAFDRTKNPDEVNRSEYVISQDGMIAASFGDEKIIRRWETRTGKALPPLVGHTKNVECLAFSRDGKRIVSSGKDLVLRVWDADSAREVGHIALTTYAAPFDHRPITEFAISPDGKRLAAGQDFLCRFDLKAIVELQAPEGHCHTLMSVAFGPDSKTVLTAGWDSAVRRWDTIGNPKQVLSKLPIFHGIDFSVDGQRAAIASGFAGGPTPAIDVWELNSGNKILHVPMPGEGASGVAFSPDGMKLACSSWSKGDKGYVASLWDANSGKPLWGVQAGPIPLGDNPVFSADGSKLWGRSLEPGPQCLRAADGSLVCKLRFPCVAIAIAPNDATLFASHIFDNSKLALQGIELVSGKIRLEFGRQSNEKKGGVGLWPLPPAVSRDGRILAAVAGFGASSGARVAVLWDCFTGEEIARLAGHEMAITHLAFSPDGKLLATASADCTVLLWDMAPIRAKLKPIPEPKVEDLPALWAALADADAAKAYRAIVSLRAAGPAAIAFIQPKLKPAALDRREIERLIGELGANDFTAREKAQAALAAMEQQVEPMLRAALKRELPAEARRRVQQVLDGLDGFVHAGERLRELRAVEVIESVSGEEARKLLGELAKGDADALLTQEAQTALRRMGR